jgi:hypothetical protein
MMSDVTGRARAAQSVKMPRPVAQTKRTAATWQHRWNTVFKILVAILFLFWGSAQGWKPFAVIFQHTKSTGIKVSWQGSAKNLSRLFLA